MRVLLSGATGYLGSAVLSRLLADGHEVVGHARSEASAARLAEGGEKRPPSAAAPGPVESTPFRARRSAH